MKQIKDVDVLKEKLGIFKLFLIPEAFKDLLKIIDSLAVEVPKIKGADNLEIILEYVDNESNIDSRQVEAARAGLAQLQADLKKQDEDYRELKKDYFDMTADRNMTKSENENLKGALRTLAIRLSKSDEFCPCGNVVQDHENSEHWINHALAHPTWEPDAR